jgi:hypothetical protein
MLPTIFKIVDPLEKLPKREEKRHDLEIPQKWHNHPDIVRQIEFLLSKAMVHDINTLLEH